MPHDTPPVLSWTNVLDRFIVAHFLMVVNRKRNICSFLCEILYFHAGYGIIDVIIGCRLRWLSHDIQHFWKCVSLLCNSKTRHGVSWINSEMFCRLSYYIRKWIKAPPEDCGGIGGYHELLERISDGDKDVLAWVGATKWDEQRVDGINKELKWRFV